VSVAPAAIDTRSRLHALDGLRGLAAVVVVASHVFDYNSVPADLMSLWLLSPFGLLVNGAGAVHLFFVLSGFVLALSLSRDERPGRLPRFYLRRWFRIHPPYMAAVAFAWLVASALVARGLVQPTGWALMPTQKFLRVFLFPSNAYGLLGVGWSLFVEMAMSMLFPLLFFLARRVHPGIALGLGVLCLYDLDPRLKFLRFLFDFAIGLSLFLASDRIAGIARRWPRGAGFAAVAGGIGLLQLPYAFGLASSGRMAGLEEGQSSSVVVPFALGAALLVCAAIHAPPLQRLLSTPIAKFYGRISYSLYLFHFAILWIVEFGVFGKPHSIGTAFLVFAATLAIATGAAELGWRFVEAPAIRAGRAVIRAGEAFARRVAS
jgi:peptidoglycan/LPS O-acetylase OafA/YrhL